MKKIIFIFFFFISFSSTHLFAQGKILDIDEVVKTNQNSDKKIMFFFHMEHCPYCKRMKNNTLQEKQIKQLMEKHFVVLDIDTENGGKVFFQNKTYTNLQFAHLNDVDFFPSVLFFDKENEVVYKARGYRDSKTFEHILQFIITEMYDEMSFFEYLEEHNVDKE